MEEKHGGEITFDEELIEPICQLTVIKYPDLGDGKERIMFANPAHESERINGTVRLSEDGGLTWKYAKTVHQGNYVYSCLTILPNNEIGLLYEVEYKDEEYDVKLFFTKFNLDWIKLG